MTLPSVPVFLSVTGLYEVEFVVSVACRDSCIYSLKRGGKKPKYKISLGSQPCGIVGVDNHIVAGCMDNTLGCYTIKVRCFRCNFISHNQ